MHRQSVLQVVHDQTEAAALECRTHNLLAAGNAFEVLGQTTVAIGAHTRGWEKAFGSAVGPVLHHKRKASPAQKRALAKARRAKKQQSGRITTKRAAHRAKKSKRTPAQQRATRKMIAAAKRARRAR